MYIAIQASCRGHTRNPLVVAYFSDGWSRYGIKTATIPPRNQFIIFQKGAGILIRGL